MNNSGLVDLSYEFLSVVRRGGDSESYRSDLAWLEESQLESLTDETNTATAFWINLYNAFVQTDLERDLSLYERKCQFFGQDRHTVAGTQLSLDDIEHGILRSSKWKYGLGYVPRLLPSSFERTHRLLSVDPRIHFALNCGAESCPPIAAYTQSNLDDELDTSTRSFLQQSSTYDSDAGVVRTTRLFRYYLGDFGGHSGVYAFLEQYDVVEDGARPRIRYTEYDWTLHKGMYRTATDED